MTLSQIALALVEGILTWHEWEQMVPYAIDYEPVKNS